MAHFRITALFTSIVGLCVIGLVLLGGVRSAAQAQTASYAGWQVVKDVLPIDVDLRSVFLMDKNNTWMAGADARGGGHVYHLYWDETAWTVQDEMRFDRPVNAVVAVSNSDVWAVGDMGLLVHGGNSGWQTVVLTTASVANFTTIQMFGESEGWLGGYMADTVDVSLQRPLLAHYLAGKWVVDSSVEGRGTIASLHFAGGGGWAVGSSVWGYDKGRWAEEVTPAFCSETVCAGDYSGVRAISADEAWAVGSKVGTCAVCLPQAYMIHRVGGAWHRYYPDDPGVTAPSAVADPYFPSAFNALVFTGPESGLIVGAYQSRTNPGADLQPLVWGYGGSGSSGHFLYDAAGGYPLRGQSPVSGVVRSVSSIAVTDDPYFKERSLAVGPKGLLLSYGYLIPVPPPLPTVPLPNPTAYVKPPTERVSDPQHANITYFPLVGHTLRGGFRDYWQKHGGLEQFGFPITEEYEDMSPTDGKVYITQWFERARMEWHPGNKQPYDVLLGLLGREVVKGREGEAAFKRVPAPTTPGAVYFSETGHTLAPELATFWWDKGGLPAYGYPISEPFVETSKTNGKPYLVQYFERNRLEYHPDAQAGSQVLLGLLGVDLLRVRGWLP